MKTPLSPTKPSYTVKNSKKLLGLGVALLISPALAAQTLIPTSLSAPDGAIDKTTSGFTIRMHQLLDERDPRHDLSIIEQQIAGSLVNPLTQEPFTNEIDDQDPDYQKDDDGNFIASTINFNDETDPFQDTIGESGNFTPDDKYPGIPGFGSGEGSNDFVMEAIAFLELKAGTNRLGVNSDDGFRVTMGVGTNPKDAFAIQPDGAVFSGARGAADSEWDIEVESDGIYPVRLITWDGGGGASAEFYSVNPPEPGGEKILINASNNANAIKAYRTAETELAFAKSISPTQGASDVFLQPTVSVVLEDAGTEIEASSIKFTYDGQDVTSDSSVNKSGRTTTASYTPPDFEEAHSEHTTTVEFSDTAGNTRSHTWSFTIGAFSILPVELAFPTEAKDTSAPGFIGAVHQARIDAGLNPSYNRADAQIRGTLLDPFTGEPFENTASLTTFTEEGAINFEEEQRNNGNFDEDKLFPGIPNSDEGHDDQFAVEFVGYLELDEGFHVFGVHSQDGFRLSVGNDGRDLFWAERIGGADGIRLEPNDDVLLFRVDQAGLYSFRLLGFEGGDESLANGSPTEGAALEFYSIDLEQFKANPETAEKTLINDPSNPNSIKAWRQVTEPARAYVKSVFPAPNSISQPITSNLEIIIPNLTDETTISLKLNGAEIEPTRRNRRGETTLTFDPDSPFEKGTTYQVELTVDGQVGNWEFATSSGDIFLLIVNEGESAGDFALKDRLQKIWGFDVLSVDDLTVQSGGFTAEDAAALSPVGIYFASSIQSGQVVGQPWHTLSIPIIVVENAVVDDFQLSDNHGGNGGANSGKVQILNADHPLAAGFPVGEVTFASNAGSGVKESAVPEFGVAIGANNVGGRESIWGIEKGSLDLIGDPTPERRVFFGIPSDENFAFFTEDGFKLFDATIAWALSIDPPSTESEPAIFNPITFSAGNVTISWTGDGTLEEAASPEGPWRASADQSNPQTSPAIGTKFFRLQ